MARRKVSTLNKVNAQMLQAARDLLNAWLIQAAEEGDVGTIRQALAAGADVNADEGQALGNAALQGHTEAVQVLLVKRADVHAYDDLALRMAAWYGRAETVKSYWRRVQMCMSMGKHHSALRPRTAISISSMYWPLRFSAPEPGKANGQQRS
jgi:hypothetical protein